MSYKREKQKGRKQENALNIVQEGKAKRAKTGKCFKCRTRRESKKACKWEIALNTL